MLNPELNPELRTFTHRLVGYLGPRPDHHCLDAAGKEDRSIFGHADACLIGASHDLTRGFPEGERASLF
jgi:hypothetical protein